VHPIEIFAALLAVVAALAAVAVRARIPYPVVLVLGGLALAAIPGLPVPKLDPQLIFLGFLPPLVYSASFLSSTYELADNARPIAVLAVGLVLATMGVITVLGHVVVGLDWPVAAVLGAIVAPTDPVAAAAVARRLTAPERLVTILEGEALVNDGTGLTAYAIALSAVGAASFSAGHAALQLVEIALGGVAIGAAVGWLSTHLRRRGDEPRVEITISLLTPFAAYLPADRLGASGVLAAVTAGLWVGRQSQGIAPAPTRLQAGAFWELLTFLLNATLFLLVGLQLRQILGALPSGQTWTLIAGAVAIGAGVLALRLAWMAVGARRGVGLLPDRGEQGERLNLRAHLVLGWCGMRGAVSLAAALALPLTVHGRPFPDRSTLVLLTFTTIVITLVLPGLTLPSLISRLGLGQGKARRREELEGRIELTHAALARLEELAEDGHDAGNSIDSVRALYEMRLETLHGRLEAEGDGSAEPGDPTRLQELRRDVLGAQREALDRMRGARELPDAVIRDIEHDLDLEDSRLRRT
jgi:monovalent cation/hydrogen antiporter